MKIKIEVDMPEGIDTRQLSTHVVDALGINDNVTDKEYEFIKRLMVAVRSLGKEYTVKRYIIFEQTQKVISNCEERAIETAKEFSWLSPNQFEVLETVYNMRFVDTENYWVSGTAPYVEF